MKKTAVAEYGYINAKLRARISMMLTDEFRNALINAENIEAAVQILSANGYSSASEIWNSTGDIQSLEYELFKNHIANLRMVMKNTTGVLSTFISMLTMKPEIENIKSVLRLWYGSKIRNRPLGYRAAYVFKEQIYEKIEWHSLINALSWEEITEVFKNTIYKNIFAKDSSPDADDGLFSIEIALDRLYYRNIFEAGKELKLNDEKILTEIISTEIDLQNISWLIRYRHFYKMKPSELSKVLIPGGHGIQLENLQKESSENESGFFPMDMLKKSYPELSALNISNKYNFSSQAQLFESLLDEARRRKFSGILTGYPFTIGIILVYFFMSEREIHFISSVLNGKYYQLPPDKIMEVVK